MDSDTKLILFINNQTLDIIYQWANDNNIEPFGTSISVEAFIEYFANYYYLYKKSSSPHEKD